VSTQGIESSRLTATPSSSIRRAVDWLLRNQRENGSWAGNVDTNSCIEAEWLLAGHILGVSLPHEAELIEGLLSAQRADGAWQVYYDAPGGDINSVEAYAALTAKGFDRNSLPLARARHWIELNGGLCNVRVFTRYWLVIIGVWPWDATPDLPPEMIRLPPNFQLSIYNFAQWARATLVPLAVISARRPVWPLPGGNKLDELFPEGHTRFDFHGLARPQVGFSLKWLFAKVDRLLHFLQTHRLVPGRETAIKLCLEWMIRHQDADGSWGGIQPPWIYGLLALKNEGYSLSHPVIRGGLAALEDGNGWTLNRGTGRRIQATESSVWERCSPPSPLRKVAAYRPIPRRCSAPFPGYWISRSGCRGTGP
jgi:squalene-hopene/tetraprenyl-beta-curcumene cyclase